MNDNINKQLLSIVYEIEGLLLLADEKSPETPPAIYDMIKDKIHFVSQNLPQIETEIAILESSQSINDILPEAFAIDIDDEQEEDRSHGNMEDDCSSFDEPEDERSHGNLEDDDEDIYVDESEDERSHGNLEDDYEPLDCSISQEDLDNEHEDVVDETIVSHEYETIQNDVALPADEVSDGHIDDGSDLDDADSDSVADFDVVDDDFFEPIDSDVAELDDDIVTLDASDDFDDVESLTVEEKLAIQNSKDLRKAFTINDRFRFRRELFGNSDTEFTDALHLISAMKSFSEAQEYFYIDQQWDKDNPEVIDFMKIVANYLNSK